MARTRQYESLVPGEYDKIDRKSLVHSQKVWTDRLQWDDPTQYIVLRSGLNMMALRKIICAIAH